MADTTINFTIPEAQIARIENTIKWIYPIPQIPDPEWVDPKDGSLEPYINEFTDNEWIQEAIERWLINKVYKYEQYEAKQEINITKDNTLIN